jgi:hypothetical protein
MLIGDSATYEGRAHVVVGFTPVSVTPALIELRDLETGALAWVDRRLVREDAAPERAAVRLVGRKRRRRR